MNSETSMSPQDSKSGVEQQMNSSNVAATGQQGQGTTDISAKKTDAGLDDDKGAGAIST